MAAEPLMSLPFPSKAWFSDFLSKLEQRKDGEDVKRARKTARVLKTIQQI
jgi:hypothetical protein